MIKYVTTLNDIVGSHVQYYLYSKLNVTQETLGAISLDSMILADMSKSGCEELILDDSEESDYRLTIFISNTATAKYASIGSIIFVVDSTPIGYFNLPKIVNIKQSTHYEFVITFDQIECNVTNMVISTDITKYNPNMISDKNMDYRVDHKVLAINEYNSYTKEYKKNRVNEVVPTETNPRFSSVGGVFQYKNRLMNWATQFVNEKTIDDTIIGAKFLYGKELTSLIMWSSNAVYKFKNIFSRGMTLSQVTLTSNQLRDLTTDEPQPILDCGDNSILIGTPQSFRVLAIDWTTLNLFDYRREIKNACYYIDNLDNELNIIDHYEQTYNPDNIRTSITREHWIQLASDEEVAFNLAQYRRYLANYRDTFVFEKISRNELDGVLILGGGGIGANIGKSELQAMPVGIPEGYDFYELIEQGKLKFEFLSTSLIRMYAEGDGEDPYIFDNLISADINEFKAYDTLQALRSRLRFLRLTSDSVTTRDRLVFGDGIVFKFRANSGVTTIKQL